MWLIQSCFYIDAMICWPKASPYWKQILVLQCNDRSSEAHAHRGKLPGKLSHCCVKAAWFGVVKDQSLHCNKMSCSLALSFCFRWLACSTFRMLEQKLRITQPGDTLHMHFAGRTTPVVPANTSWWFRSMFPSNFNDDWLARHTVHVLWWKTPSLWRHKSLHLRLPAPRQQMVLFLSKTFLCKFPSSHSRCVVEDSNMLLCLHSTNTASSRSKSKPITAFLLGSSKGFLYNRAALNI